MPPNCSGLEMPSRPRSPAFAQDIVDWEAAGFFPFVDVGVDLAVDEGADGAAQCLVFLGEDHFLLFSVWAFFGCAWLHLWELVCWRSYSG